MITIEQCRAARGLLDWTQQDLADKSGLSKTAINNFEKGYSNIKGESLRAITHAFECAEIEFIDRTGIKRKSETTSIFKGNAAFSNLMDDIKKSLPDFQELLITNIDRKFAENDGPAKMNDLLDHCAAHKKPVRVICSGDFPNGGLQARHLFIAAEPGIIMFVYGRKTAFVLWGRSVIIIVDSHEAAEAERRHFEHLWALSSQKILQENMR